MDNLTRCLRTFEDYRAMDVDRALCDRMRAQAGTEQMVRINTTALRAFLVWGEQNGYFSALQAELLPRACSMPAPGLRRTVTRVEDDLDAQGQRARMNGQSERYIRDEDAPSRERSVSLRIVLGRHFPLWGALAPELAANTGARWGEQFQLTAHDVHLAGCVEYGAAHIHIEWQVDGASDKSARRTLPKGDKTRVIPVPSASFTGYRLRDAVRDRVAEALEEQCAGANPEALLFPATQGGMLWYSSFNSDVLLPAMMFAGWPVTTWVEEGSRWDDQSGQFVRVRTTRRKAELPWHTLRHRFAASASTSSGCRRAS